MKANRIYALIISIGMLLWSLAEGRSANSSDERGDVLLKMLQKGAYDAKIPPNFNKDEPAVVTVQLVVLSIDSVNEAAMDYSMTIYLRQTWTDERLTFSAITHNTNSSSHGHEDHSKEGSEGDAKKLQQASEDNTFSDGAHKTRSSSRGDEDHSREDSKLQQAGRNNTNKEEEDGHGAGKDHSHNRLELDSRIMGKVWFPDTFFINERKAAFHQVTVPNKLMHIHSDGKVLYSIRLSMTLTCHMNLAKYPFDIQICPLTLSSYGFTEETLVYRWHPEEPVIVTGDVELPTFAIAGWKFVECKGDFSLDGYSCIEAKVSLSRSSGHHIIQVYIPSILIVMLSWVNFWLDIEAVPARISLGLLTVLTMTTMSSGATSNLPKVSYIKAIDLWMSMCLLFVFAALLEFAYVNVTSRVQKRRLSMRDAVKLATAAKAAEEGKAEKVKKSFFRRSSTPESNATKMDRARQVDKYSRIAFPISFACFNLFYWCFYMI